MDIGSTTQGVSADGLESLYQQIRAHMIDDAKAALEDNSGVQEAIEAMWVGTDEQKFWEHYLELVASVEKALDYYDNALKTEFQKAYDQWKEFQAQNVK